MLKSNVKVAFRNLHRSKSSSFINIGGLAVGMAVAMLIGLWSWDEWSFDRSFKNYERIAQVKQNQTFNGEVQTSSSEALQLGPELRTTYGSSFKYVVMSSWTNDHLLSIGEKKFTQNGNFMEPDIAEMLSLNMRQGSRSGLKDPGSILLCASAARTLFGNADPMDKILKIDNKMEVKVTGVYEDLSYNSSFANLQFIAPWDLLVRTDGLEKRVGWGNSWFQAFVQIADQADMDKVSLKIRDAKLNKILNLDEGARYKPVIFLHPMRKWHLYSEFRNGVNTGGRILFVWLFIIIGAFVLLLACINFMNLSTARSEKRAKEVGIRKAIGSLRGQLISQFYSESILVAGFAFVLSLLLVQLLLPFFNAVADKKMQILWSNPLFWLLAIGFSLLTGLIAGSYPALYLSSFQPIKVLRGTFRLGRFASMPRKVLVVLQFTVSIILIIGTVVVFRQIRFAQDRPVGYSREGLLAVPIKTENIHTHYAAFRDDLLRTGAVEEIAASESPVTDLYITNSGYDWKGKDPNMQEEFSTLRITPEFGKTTGWQIVQGRDFSRDFATDSSGFILNEAAVRYMGLKDPVGQTIKWGDNGNYKIIGVVKDLVMQSPYEPVRQTIFFLDAKGTSILNIRIDPKESAAGAIAKIETVFKRYDPSNIFEYRFVDQEYAKKFGNEVRIGKLATFFAVLAILISALGLFGLASYVAEQRTREIGLRKVLGASVLNLWRMLSRDFIGLVFIAFLIATPLAWYFMSRWLQNYHYHTSLSWWIFAATALGAMLVTLATVSYQAIRAALMNPVKSLKME